MCIIIGIYQCVARNVAGETQATGLLSWENKSYMKRPEKVKCYPINHSTVLVEYQSKTKWNDIVYYTSSKTDTGTQIWLSNHLESVNKKEFQIKRLKLPLFETFWFYIRGLERTGSEKKGESGSPHTLFEMSRLSKGIKCSLQGRTYKLSYCVLYLKKKMF